MIGTLIRIDKTANSGETRSESITGKFMFTPKIGHGFVIASDTAFDGSKDKKRHWFTSPVESIEELEGGYRFKTASGSLYELSVEGT